MKTVFGAHLLSSPGVRVWAYRSSNNELAGITLHLLGKRNVSMLTLARFAQSQTSGAEAFRSR